MISCPPAPRRLRPPERLLARAQFVRVQTSAKRFRGQRLTLLVGDADLTPHRLGEGRLGLTVSRRVGNAVVRNRVRRRLKEIVRLAPGVLCAGFDHVVVAHASAAGADSDVLRQELTCLLRRARAWAQPIRPSTPSLPCTA